MSLDAVVPNGRLEGAEGPGSLPRPAAAVPIWHRALLSVADVAELCGVSVPTVNRWTTVGKLKTVPHCGVKKIARATLDAWLLQDEAA